MSSRFGSARERSCSSLSLMGNSREISNCSSILSGAKKSSLSYIVSPSLLFRIDGAQELHRAREQHTDCALALLQNICDFGATQVVGEAQAQNLLLEFGQRFNSRAQVSILLASQSDMLGGILVALIEVIQNQVKPHSWPACNSAIVIDHLIARHAPQPALLLPRVQRAKAAVLQRC